MTILWVKHVTKVQRTNYQDNIYQCLPGKVIAYQPALAMVLDSINAAIIIGQLLYWQGLGKWGDWVYKTEEDMMMETGLSKHNQRTAIKKCVDMDILEVTHHGVPRKRHFKVKVQNLHDIIARMQESGRLAVRIPDEQSSGIRTTITESTAESTTYNIDKKKLFRSKPLKDNDEYIIGDIADAVGEEDRTFLRSVAKNRGVGVVQRGYGILKEDLIGGKRIDKPAAYLNKVIQNLA